MESDHRHKAAEVTHTLPEEIIGEILSRLPVQSLLKFRCVSKSWRSFIGTNRFVKSHLEISTKNHSFALHKIIFLDSFPPNQTLKQTSLHSLMTEQASVIGTFEVQDPIYTPGNSIDLVGCCNGLICVLIDRKSIFLWNPATRMHKKLPDVDEKLKMGYISKYGFGFDESGGDHKVFVILSVFWFTGRYESVVKTYSLKNNSWKVLKEKDVDPYLESGKFASGKLHWGTRFGPGYNWGIVSFDLKSEVYGTVGQPDYSAGEFDPSLGVLGGRLCVLSDYLHICADVWVMKEYGVIESWNKVLTVPYHCDPEDGLLSTPYCTGSRGEVLFIYGSDFIIYYPREKLFRRPDTADFSPLGEVDVYVESLVSVFSDVGL